MTEGNAGTPAEAVALVNPVTGEFIVFNMAPGAQNFSGVPGFTGTTQLGTIDGNAVQDDPAAGFSYQYDAATDSYIYGPASCPVLPAGR